jgi:hypothetical protein
MDFGQIGWGCGRGFNWLRIAASGGLLWKLW